MSAVVPQAGVVTVVFLACLLVFVLIGIGSVRSAEKTETDYLLANRSVGPWMTALSAVATNNSGFMFVGLIGATYTSGLSSIWIMVGWILGDWIAWTFIHQRLRIRSERNGSLSFSGFLATDENGQKQTSVALVVRSARRKLTRWLGRGCGSLSFTTMPCVVPRGHHC